MGPEGSKGPFQPNPCSDPTTCSGEQIPSPGGLQTPQRDTEALWDTPPPAPGQPMADTQQPPPASLPTKQACRQPAAGAHAVFRAAGIHRTAAGGDTAQVTRQRPRHEQLHGDTDGAFPLPRDHAGLNPTGGAGIRDLRADPAGGAGIQGLGPGFLSPCQDPVGPDPSGGAGIHQPPPASSR